MRRRGPDPAFREGGVAWQGSQVLGWPGWEGLTWREPGGWAGLEAQDKEGV